MAVSAAVVYNGKVVGVTRLVTSLREMDRQMVYIIAVTTLVCAGVLVIVSVSYTHLSSSLIRRRRMFTSTIFSSPM